MKQSIWRVGAGPCPRPQSHDMAGRHGGLPLRILGLLFLGSSLFAAEPGNDAYVPLTEGAQWVYQTTNKKEKEDFDMTVVIQEPWKEGEASGVIMKQKDKRGTMREFLVHSDKGIFIQKLGLSKSYTPEIFTRFSPAVPKVIYPLTPGTKVHWEGRLKVTGVMNKPILFDGEVVGFEDVSVPAGKFHCIKLHYHEKRGDDVIDEDAWYAEGVGQVKYDGGQYLKELKSYKIN